LERAAQMSSNIVAFKLYGTTLNSAGEHNGTPVLKTDMTIWQKQNLARQCWQAHTETLCKNRKMIGGPLQGSHY
jgi:hypothetical protein